MLSYTIQDVIEQTGLPDKFIRSCIELLKDDILKKYLNRGNKNAWLLDSNALTIFDQIKQLREQGFSISTIHEKLLENLDKQQETDSETEGNTGKTNIINILLKQYKEANDKAFIALNQTIEKDRIIREKDNELAQKNELISLQQSHLRLLTDGKDAIAKKNEIDFKERERIKLIMDLELLEGKWFKGKERKFILYKLKELA